MKDRPSPTHELFDEMHHVVAARLAGNASPGQECRLKELIRQDIDACDLYLDMVFESSALLTWAKDDEPDEGPARPLPLLAFFGRSIHGTVGYFSSDWPVAYLMATVIFGIGLLVGSLVPVSQPVRVAHQSASLPSPLSPLPTMVGRITGMVDCKWMENPKSEIRNPKQIRNQKSEIRNQKSFVFFGDRFALASGLMEITYDTGAKVILQSPVTYEVESATGGFLSVGKLTAKLEKSDKRGTLNAEQSDSSSLFIVHRSSFTVRTPTALVTDLGTEFGVEVDRQGGTTSHIFRGLVRLQVASADGKTEGVTQVLHQNESARVENRGGQSGGNRITILGPSAKRANFVRQLSKQSVKVFDLVNVVAGGDGFSGRRGRGIAPDNGRVILDAKPDPKYAWLVGDGKYHPVEELPFVDGVFIPDGSHGPVQTDSAGHSCDLFEATSNRTSGYVWAGAIPTGGTVTIPTTLGGVDYSAPAWPAVSTCQQGRHLRFGRGPESESQLQTVAVPRRGGQHGNLLRQGPTRVGRRLGDRRWPVAFSASGDQPFQRRNVRQHCHCRP